MNDIPDIMRILGKLEGGQEAILQLLSKQDERINNHDIRLNNHGERLGSLEKRGAYVAGAAAILAFLVSKASEFFIK